mgnify:FL=1|tara:strand:- start:2590 stop:2751 length:162 start_codon:yes stop_codon:yes gene_type:complete
MDDYNLSINKLKILEQKCTIFASRNVCFTHESKIEDVVTVIDITYVKKGLTLL